MDDVSEPPTTFGTLLECMTYARRMQLIPLDSDAVRFAYRSGVIGSEWVDNTDAHAQQLRTEIADMQAIADHLEEDGV